MTKRKKGQWKEKEWVDIVLYNYMPRKERMVSYIKLIVKNAKGKNKKSGREEYEKTRLRIWMRIEQNRIE